MDAFNSTPYNLSLNPGQRPEQVVWHAKGSLILLILTAAAIPALLFMDYLSFEPRFLIRSRVFIDDAFYYYQVAFNVWHGRGMTFDGINLSNGFQPLWLLIILALTPLTDKTGMLPLVLVVQALFLTGGLCFLGFTMLARRSGPLATILIFLCLGLFSNFIRTCFLGLETSLYVFCWGISLLMLSKAENKNFRQEDLFAVGLSAAVLNLARTDSLVFSVFVGGYIVLRCGVRSALSYALPLLLIVGSYLASNLIIFGNLMPISGAAKQAYSFSTLANVSASTGQPSWLLLLQNLLWPLAEAAYYPILAAVALNVVLLAYCVIRREITVGLFASFVVAKYLVYSCLYFRHATYAWYYAPDYIGGALLAILFWRDADNFFRRRFRLAIYAPLVALAAGFVIWLAHWQYKQESEHWTYARNIQSVETFPTSEVDLFYLAAIEFQRQPELSPLIFGMHNSGIFGYFSGLSVVNFDGLINGQKRLDYIRRYGYDFAQYMDEAQPIDAYVDFISHGAKPSYDAIFLKRGFVEVPLHESLERKYGAAKFTNAGGKLTLYVRSALVSHFKETVGLE